MGIDVLSRAKKKKFVEGLSSLIERNAISRLRPDRNVGGGLTGEVHVLHDGNKKYVVRMCGSEEKAMLYEYISKKLSREDVLPKLIGRMGTNIFYKYLTGRDLKQRETLKTFERIGKICAKINNIKFVCDVDINLVFDKQLVELTNGKYRKFTSEEMKEKRERRPNERYDRRRICALLNKKEKAYIKKINARLISKSGAGVSFDAFDVSPANFRISNNKIYFVDIDAIRPRIKGFGIAKCFFGWTKGEKQRQSFLKGYSSVLKDDFLTESYMDLLYLHFLIQSLHDRAKLGRDYKLQYKKLKSLLKRYEGVELG